MKFCPNCGAPKRSPEDTICASCGEAYPVVVQATSQPPVVPQAPAAAPVPPATHPAPAAPAARGDLPTGNLGGTGGVRPTQRFIPDLPQEADTTEATDPGELQSSIDKILNAAMGAPDIADMPEAPQPPARKPTLFDYDAELANDAPAPVAAPPAPEAPVQPAWHPTQVTSRFEPLPPEVEIPAAPVQQEEYAPVAYDYSPQETPADEYSTVDYSTIDYSQPDAYAQPDEEPVYAPEDVYEAPVTPAASLFDEEPAPVQYRATRSQAAQEASYEAYQPEEPEEKWSRLQSNSIQDLYDESHGDELGIPLPPDYDEEEYEPRKGSGLRRAVFIILGVLVFALGVFGATLGMLYYNNNANKTITSFMLNLGNQNIAALRDNVSLNQVAATDGGWQALCTAFESTVERAALESQLKAMVSGGVTDPAYPTISVKSEKLFLFLNSYYIEISQAELFLVDEYTGTRLYLNGEEVFGTQVDGGTLYSHLMPGSYTYIVDRGDGNSAPATVTALQSYNTLDAKNSGYTVTVENCLNDDAVIYVNGAEVSAKPSGGVLTLSGVEPGSSIRIVAQQGEQEREATVVFEDAASTALRFENYSGEDPVEPDPDPADNPDNSASLSAANINTILEEYYRSYLGCINEQSISGITRVTDSFARDYVQARITSDMNAANTFTFLGAAVEESSITENADGTISFNATFQYRYVPRDGSSEAADDSNRQAVVLVNDGGTWKISSMTRL